MATQSFLNLLKPKKITPAQPAQPAPSPQTPARSAPQNPFAGLGGLLGGLSGGGGGNPFAGLGASSGRGAFGSGTGDPNRDAYVYGGYTTGEPSAADYGRYGPGAGIAPNSVSGTAMSPGQENWYRDTYVNDWAANDILSQDTRARGQDSFARDVALEGRGYAPGSYGQVKDGWWTTPDGKGPNGEPAFFTSGAVMTSPEQQAAYNDPAAFLALHPDWIASAVANPSLLVNGHPIFTHAPGNIIQEAMALYQKQGGAGGGGAGAVPGGPGVAGGPDITGFADPSGFQSAMGAGAAYDPANKGQGGFGGGQGGKKNPGLGKNNKVKIRKAGGGGGGGGQGGGGNPNKGNELANPAPPRVQSNNNNNNKNKGGGKKGKK